MKLIMTKGKVKRVVDISNSSFSEVDRYATLMANKGWKVIIGGIR